MTGTLLEPLNPEVPVLEEGRKRPLFGYFLGKIYLRVCGVSILWGGCRTSKLC